MILPPPHHFFKIVACRPEDFHMFDPGWTANYVTNHSFIVIHSILAVYTSIYSITSRHCRLSKIYEEICHYIYQYFDNGADST
jgi:hypothetical protein